MAIKRDISLQNIEKENVFEVRPFYFDAMNASILKKTVHVAELKHQLKLALAQPVAHPIFQMDESYFKKLERSIASQTYNLDIEPDFVTAFEAKFKNNKALQFDVEDAYFNDVYLTVQKRLPKKTGPELLWNPFTQLKPAYLYLAASICIAMSLLFTYTFTRENSNYSLAQIDSIDKKALLAYVSDQNIEIAELSLEHMDLTHTEIVMDNSSPMNAVIEEEIDYTQINVDEL